MQIKDLISNLEFVLITQDAVVYEANDCHLGNIGGEDFVEISFYHNGEISFAFRSQGVADPTTLQFYKNPTAKDLYDFLGSYYRNL